MSYTILFASVWRCIVHYACGTKINYCTVDSWLSFQMFCKILERTNSIEFEKDWILIHMIRRKMQPNIPFFANIFLPILLEQTVFVTFTSQLTKSDSHAIFAYHPAMPFRQRRSGNEAINFASVSLWTRIGTRVGSNRWSLGSMTLRKSSEVATTQLLLTCGICRFCVFSW